MKTLSSHVYIIGAIVLLFAFLAIKGFYENYADIEVGKPFYITNKDNSKILYYDPVAYYQRKNVYQGKPLELRNNKGIDKDTLYQKHAFVMTKDKYIRPHNKIFYRASLNPDFYIDNDNTGVWKIPDSDGKIGLPIIYDENDDNKIRQLNAKTKMLSASNNNVKWSTDKGDEFNINYLS